MNSGGYTWHESWHGGVGFGVQHLDAHDWDSGEHVKIDLYETDPLWEHFLSHNDILGLNQSLGYTAIQMSELPNGLQSGGVIHVDSTGQDDHDFNYGEDVSDANVTFNIDHPSGNNLVYDVNQFAQGDVLNLPESIGHMSFYSTNNEVVIRTYDRESGDGQLILTLTGLDLSSEINTIEAFNQYFGEGSLNFI